MQNCIRWSVVFAGVCLVSLAQIAVGQDVVPAPAPVAQTTESTAQPAAATPASSAPEPTVAAVTAPAAPTAAAVTPAAAKPAEAAKPKPSKKVEYTGPTEVVVLAPTPMLDEEGKQRMDPDGKLMFNKPVAQQRDKKGHPLFNEQNKPVFQTATELGYDDHGKKLHAEKVKPPKMTPVTISRGTFTIDGMIGKAEMNYDIADLKFIYLYAPAIGTIVVSNEPFPGATEEAKAFNETTLTVTTGDHTLQLASDKRMLSKKPESAYVLLDRSFKLPSKYPVVGYGTVLKAPYQWPGGKPNTQLSATSAIQAPPVPDNLRPVMLLKPCPAGQMRKAAPQVLPGQVAPDQPCVLISKSAPVQTAAVSKTDTASPVGAAVPTADATKTSSPR